LEFKIELVFSCSDPLIALAFAIAVAELVQLSVRLRYYSVVPSDSFFIVVWGGCFWFGVSLGLL